MSITNQARMTGFAKNFAEFPAAFDRNRAGVGPRTVVRADAFDAFLPDAGLTAVCRAGAPDLVRNGGDARAVADPRKLTSLAA